MDRVLVVTSIDDAEILRRPSKEIDVTSKECRRIVQCLKSTLAGLSGAVGLAAPQIGYNVKIFAVKTGLVGSVVYINPRIVRLDPSQVLDVEGCLSLPGQEYAVLRSASVIIQYNDTDRRTLTAEITDPFIARVIQHEYDHLKGKLIDVTGLGDAA